MPPRPFSNGSLSSCWGFCADVLVFGKIFFLLFTSLKEILKIFREERNFRRFFAFEDLVEHT